MVAAAIVLGVFTLEAWQAATGLFSGPNVRSLGDGASGKLRFVSRNADWSEFREGRFKGAQVTITGDLILPDEPSGPFPAAVLLHGSDGLSDHEYDYSATLAEWGIASFVLDSFGPRGVETTVGNQDAVSPYSMLVDAYAALKLLSTHPKIDPSKIVLIGWSKGGLVSDWASRKRYRDRLVGDDVGFAAHVAFYPWCGEQDFRIELTGAPLLYLLGESDDWSGSQACVDYISRLNAAGYRGRAIVYPNALHGFDYAGRFKTYLPHAMSWKNCFYFVRKQGFVVAQTGRFEKWPSLDRYIGECAQKGAHVGSNVRARERAITDLRQFLSAVFKSRFADGAAQ
jgi:dienelactone hydrolase